MRIERSSCCHKANSQATVSTSQQFSRLLVVDEQQIPRQEQFLRLGSALRLWILRWDPSVHPCARGKRKVWSTLLPGALSATLFTIFVAHLPMDEVVKGYGTHQSELLVCLCNNMSEVDGPRCSMQRGRGWPRNINKTFLCGLESLLDSRSFRKECQVEATQQADMFPMVHHVRNKCHPKHPRTTMSMRGCERRKNLMAMEEGCLAVPSRCA